MNTHTPIPLRPDRDALRSSNVTALMRACFAAANREINPHQTRSAAVPATTTGSGWADKLSPAVVTDFIASLVPLSAGARLLEAAPRVSLDGAASLLFPRRSGAISSTAVPWVTEGDPAPVLQFVLDSATLDSAKKLIAIVVMTRELMEHTSANVVMRRLLAENVAAALDASLFSTTASSTSRPAGILNGVTPLTATAGGGEAAMLGDLAQLAKAIAPATAGLAFVAHPAQAALINLRRGTTYPDVPVWPTLGVASGTVIALDPAAFVSGFGGEPEISASTETLLHMESTTPAQFGTVGSPNVVAAPGRSIFQTDAVALKIRLRASWAWRAAGAVAWVQSATW